MSPTTVDPADLTQSLYQIAAATSDANGNITIKFPNVPINFVWTGTVQVYDATGIEAWQTLVSSAVWGNFVGSNLFGPVQALSGSVISITASSLTANTTYHAVLIGSADPIGKAPAIPLPIVQALSPVVPRVSAVLATATTVGLGANFTINVPPYARSLRIELANSGGASRWLAVVEGNQSSIVWSDYAPTRANPTNSTLNSVRAANTQVASGFDELGRSLLICPISGAYDSSASIEVDIDAGTVAITVIADSVPVDFASPDNPTTVIERYDGWQTFKASLAGVGTSALLAAPAAGLAWEICLLHVALASTAAGTTSAQIQGHTSAADYLRAYALASGSTADSAARWFITEGIDLTSTLGVASAATCVARLVTL